jgi:hypothetical protein
VNVQLVVRIVILAAMLGVVPSSTAQPSAASSLREACVVQINERTAALVGKDWPQLERLARRYLASCRGVFGAADLSTAHEHLAFIGLETNRPIAALSAVEDCIATFYGNSGCHVKRVAALVKLKRLREAREALGVAERLVRHNLSLAEGNLRRATVPHERELYSAHIEEYQAQAEWATALRELLAMM